MINKVQLEDGGGQREREGLYYLCVFSEGCFPADGSRGKNNRIFLPFARILLPLEIVRSSRDSQFLVRFVSFI